MAEPSTQSNWLELVFSGPGAIIAICITLIVIFVLLTFSTDLRILISKLKLKLGFGDKHLEISSADQPAQEPVEEGGPASVKPAEPEEVDEQLGLQEVVSDEDELSLEVKDDSKFHMMMLRAGLRDRDTDKIETAYQEWNAFDGRQFTDEELETLRCKMRLKAGVKAAEDELKELEQNNAAWVEPSRALVEHFRNLARLDLAMPHAQKAIDRSEDDFGKAYSYKEMADILVQLDTQANALELLNNAILKVTEKEAKAIILDKVAEIHKAAKDKLMAEKALEHALKLIPSDKDRRFKLAYIYSDHGQHHLALFHYQILTEQDPHYSSALNNLGAAYGRLGLPGKCIKTWKRAASFGEVYSMGNLAIDLIGHGFYDEAHEVIEDVPVEHRNDPHVIRAITLMESTNDREEEELNKHIEAMKLRHKYMLLSVEAEQKPELNELTEKDIVGDWASASGAKLKIEFTEGKGLLTGGLKAELIESIKSGGLAGLLVGASPPSENKFNLHLFKNGLVITGTGYPLDQQGRSTVLSGPPKNRNYFLVVTGKTNIQGIYWTDYKYPQEISFNRS